MKTILLRSSLILCLVFLGFKNADASITVNDATVTTGNIYQGQLDIAVAGLVVTSSNNSTTNLTGATFTINQSLTGALVNAQLVSSASPYDPTNYTVISNTPSTQNATTITFSGFSSAVTRNNNTYYYLIVDYTGAATTGTYTFKPTTYTTSTTTGNQNVSTPINTNSFTLNKPLLTLASDNNGLAGTTLTASQNTIAIYGMSLSSQGTSTFNKFTFPTSLAAGTAISTYFPSVTLYSSTTSATYSTANAQPVSGATTGVLTGNSVAITVPTQTIADNTTVYYFLVVNYTQPSTNTNFSFSSPTVTITGNTTTTGTAPGQTYTLTAPVLNIAVASIGTQNTNGLASSPIINSQKYAIYGFSLVGSGGGAAKTINTINIATTNAGGHNNNYYYANVYLYSAPSSTFPGATDPSVTLLTPTPVTTGANTTDISFTGLNISVSSGSTTYYFVVIDYAGIAAASNSQLDFDNAKSGATTLTTTYSGNGYNYQFSNPSLVVAANNAAAYTGNLDHDLTKTVLFSFSATPTGTASVTGFTITGTGTGITNLSTYFPTTSFYLYSSTQATFPGIGSATLVKTITSPTNTTISITGLTESISSKLYYYLVVDYADKIVDATTAGLQFKLTTVTSTATVTGTTVTGGSYTLSSPVTLANPTFSNVATSLVNSASNVAILGFSVTTTQAESFNKFVLTTSAGTISPYFTGTPVLYVSTTASSSGATAVSTGSYVVTSTTVTVNLTTAQTFAAAGVKYYYLVFPTYTAPTADASFELDGTSVSTSTYAYTNGAPAQGTNYILGPAVYDWTGASSTDWKTAGNWKINGVTATNYPGQSLTTDPVRIGTNVTFTTQPTLSSSVSIGSILFGYNNGNGITLTITGTAATLTAGTITQNHYTSDDQLTVITGTGNMVCSGDFTIGDATQPDANAQNVTSVTSTITHITINGNLVLNSNGRGTSNPGDNYPYFGLAANKLTLIGQIKFTANNSPLSFGTGRGGDNVDYYQNLARFNMDMIANSPTTLELQNANTIPSPGANFYVDFTDLKGFSTVIYDDPNANDIQSVYTNGTAGLGTNDYNYINLIFSGPSTKQVAGSICTIGGAWTTSGGNIDLSTYAPSVTVTAATEGRNVTDVVANPTSSNNWINSSNVAQGAANIEVGYSMTNNANTITCGSGTFQVDGQFTNNAGSFVCGSGSVIYKGGYLNKATFTAGTGAVSFTGTQTLQDISTGGTTFNDVNFNSGTATISSGTANFAVSNIGRLKMSNSAKLNAGTTTIGGVGYLTLMSNATSTATAYTPSGTSIVGNVNVQRWVTGGSGYRGYRLFSSPVNVSLSTAGAGNLALGYLGVNGTFANNTYLGAFTEGPGTGFTYNGSFNPIIYLYDETRTSSNQGFTAGKNIGIYSITTNTVTTLTSGVQQANVSIPVGNSYLLYYVGDNHLTTQTAVLTSRIPESTAITATGYLNQGNVIVSFWKSKSTTIPYDVNGGNLPGLNQVGNPYPSTIKLSQFYSDNTATGISPQFWVLDATTGLSGAYISYNASSGATSSSKAGNYVVSGQGFLVQATGTGSGANLTFKEDQKVDYPAITSTSGAPNGSLVMDIPSSPKLSNADVTAQSFAQINPVATGTALRGLHLQLSKDSTAYTQTGIYYSTKWNDTYTPLEDAMDLDGATPKVYLSSYSSDGKRLSINQLGDYAQNKRIKLYAGATTSGLYTISLADIANIDTVNYNVFLVDRKMNDSLDMVRYKSYAFNINNSDTSTYGANRFILVIERIAVPKYSLISFNGAKVTTGVKLTWITLNAGNYTGYILQKMDSNGNFNPLYTVQSDNSETSYSYVDQSPVIGNNTYRLAQNGINGQITYSNTITIQYIKTPTVSGLTLYPNPSNSIINVIYNDGANANSTSKYSVDIFNSAGTFIKHESINNSTWTENISAYKIGVYVLELKDNTGNLVGQTKFIKNL